MKMLPRHIEIWSTVYINQRKLLTVVLKSCQSPKFMFISFFSSSMLHWDRTRPFMLAWEITKSECSAKQDIFFSMYTFSSQIHTFLIVAVYWESRFWSMPSISLTRSQTTSVLIELSSIDGVPETTEAEPWYTHNTELLVPLNYITTVCIWKISEAFRLLPQEINHADF